MEKDKYSPAGQMDMADTGNWSLGHGVRRNNAGCKKGEGSKCGRTIIINSSLHVTVANLMFYITLFKVTLLDVFNYLKSNLNLKLLPLNSGN